LSGQTADISVTSIFDNARARFTRDPVESFLNDAARVLRPGGKAPLHHLNDDAPPKWRHRQNPHARNQMTLLLFQCNVAAAGLTTLAATPVEWGAVSRSGLRLVGREAGLNTKD
jgi:hypothetical protein